MPTSHVTVQMLRLAYVGAGSGSPAFAAASSAASDTRFATGKVWKRYMFKMPSGMHTMKTRAAMMTQKQPVKIMYTRSMPLSCDWQTRTARHTFHGILESITRVVLTR